ncbi:hypothetical protein NKH77_15365 [Streptomyces sp. M19]
MTPRTAVNAGRWSVTGASRSRVPRSISWTVRTAVNSLVRDARSKTVSGRAGTRPAGGSSTPGRRARRGPRTARPSRTRP